MQEKIETYCRNNQDKVLHFIIGLLLSQLAYIWIWFIAFPVILGLVKELYDEYVRKTGFNWQDLLATVLGVVPVLVIITFLYLIK